MGFKIKTKDRGAKESCSFKTPILYNSYEDVPAGTADPIVPTVPFPGLMPGLDITWSSCDHLIAKIEFYDDGDTTCNGNCPPATAATPTLVEAYVQLPMTDEGAGHIPGYIQTIEIVAVPAYTADSAADFATAQPLTADTVVNFTSCSESTEPCCKIPTPL